MRCDEHDCEMKLTEVCVPASEHEIMNEWICPVCDDPEENKACSECVFEFKVGKHHRCALLGNDVPECGHCTEGYEDKGVWYKSDVIELLEHMEVI